jgi:hypothetical protein
MQHRHIEAVRLQELAKQIAYDRIVVDDKDLWIHGEILDRRARRAADCFLTNAYPMRCEFFGAILAQLGAMFAHASVRPVNQGSQHISALPLLATRARVRASHSMCARGISRNSLRTTGSAGKHSQRVVSTVEKRAFLRASARRGRRDDSSCDTSRRMRQSFGL